MRKKKLEAEAISFPKGQKVVLLSPCPMLYLLILYRAFVISFFSNTNACRAWCRSTLPTRVPMVTKEDQDEAMNGILDEHLLMCGLQVNLGDIAREDEIIIANINGESKKTYSGSPTRRCK